MGQVSIARIVRIALRRAVPTRTLALFAAIGLLLGMQGLVGWIMVASGLEPGMTAVAPLKLILHLVLACLFFAALVAMFIRLGGAERETAAAATRRLAWALVALAFVQIALGGLVAGHDAGLTYNTWPLMDGRFIPPGLAMLEPLWLNLADNVATIQFNHRLGAYLLSAAVLAYAFAVRRESRPARHRAVLLSALMLAQLALGIATLVQIVPIGLALAHQGMALVLLFTLVWNASVFIRARWAPR
jgi:cytochrome c oxidase assembly protein subunit 15